jgi:hypothetical protein
MITVNTQPAGWDDVHLRRTVAYALNRTDIMAPDGGCANAASTLVPPRQRRTVNVKAVT